MCVWGGLRADSEPHRPPGQQLHKGWDLNKTLPTAEPKDVYGEALGAFSWNRIWSSFSLEGNKASSPGSASSDPHSLSCERRGKPPPQPAATGGPAEGEAGCCGLGSPRGQWHWCLTEAARGEAGECRPGLPLAGASAEGGRPPAESYQHRDVRGTGMDAASARPFWGKARGSLMSLPP